MNFTLLPKSFVLTSCLLLRQKRSCDVNRLIILQRSSPLFSTTATVIMGRDDNAGSDRASSDHGQGNRPQSPSAQPNPNQSPPMILWSPKTFDDHSLLHRSFMGDQKNVVAQNACSKVDPLDVCLSRSGVDDMTHVFSHRVEEVKPMTNQKSSGRCWLFAFLNAIRVPFVKHHNLESFEFSQSHLFFYDKLERANYFLNTIVETAKRGEPVGGQLMSFLLQSPIGDGGQWDMAVNLVRKYGLMPKQNFQESYSSESSMRINSILKTKLREYTKQIRDAVGKGDSDTAIQALLKSQMNEIHRVVSICLGIPKESITWEFYDKSKAYHKVGPVTPIQFYEQCVKPVFDVDQKVCLVHDPRPNHSYSRAYSVEFLGNVVGGQPTIYNNQPIEYLLELTGKSIRGGQPVWFGCEVAKRFAAKQGFSDIRIHDYNSVFGLDVGVGLNKADRLIFGDSAMSHSMLFTGVSFVDDTDTATVGKLRVENSWGEDRGEKGFLLMTAEWFREFVFEVVVDRSLVSQEVLDVFRQEPVLLPAWDPLGALALRRQVTEQRVV